VGHADVGSKGHTGGGPRTSTRSVLFHPSFRNKTEGVYSSAPLHLVCLGRQRAGPLCDACVGGTNGPTTAGFRRGVVVNSGERPLAWQRTAAWRGRTSSSRVARELRGVAWLRRTGGALFGGSSNRP
jgi:hypothetical protein